MDDVPSFEQVQAENQRLRAALVARDEQRAETQIHWLEHVNDAIFVADTQWRIQQWNRAAEQMYGWASADAVSQPIWEVIPVVRYFDGESNTSATQTLIEHGSWRGTFVQHSRDGRKLVIDGSTRAILDPQGAITGYIGINRDISARFHAQHELREQARVLDQAHVLVRDLESRIILWTYGAEQMYGYTQAEALEQVSHTLLQTQFPEPLDQIMDTLQASGHWSGTLTHHTRAGQIVRVASHWILDRDPDGQSYRVIESNTDITELVRANTHLQVLAEASQVFAQAGLDYQALLESIAQIASKHLAAVSIIRLLSNDGESLWLSAMYDQAAKVPGEVAQSMITERVAIDSLNPVAQVARTGQPILMTSIDIESHRGYLAQKHMTSLRQDPPHTSMIVPLQSYGRLIGTVSFSRSDPLLPTFDHEDLRLAQELAERAALAIANARLYTTAQLELTARERAEQALVNEHARVVQLKNEFMATMSHELRTPLAGVLGYTELLLDQVYGPLSERQASAVEHIDENGRNLLVLINDILDYTKFEAGKTVLDIGFAAVPALCLASVELVRASAQAKQIGLTSTLDSRVVVIDADSRRVQQMLVNLLSNAVKFTPKGGQIGLEVRGDAERGQAIFTVWDTGIGIAEDDLGKLFKPFTQLDSRLSREYEGTGLGLALVRRIAEAHGGSVVVESRPGQGSRFSIVLPWQPSAIPKAPTEIRRPQVGAHTPAPTPTLESGGAPPAETLPSILLVEDNRGNVLLTQEILSLHGYSALVARTAADGLALAREQRPALVLMDIQMPGMSGLQAIERMRADPELQNMPVIALTALVLPGDRERCLEAGANAYLPKPFSAHTLIATIEQLLEQKP